MSDAPEPRHVPTRVTIYAPAATAGEIIRKYVAMGYRPVEGPPPTPGDSPGRAVVVLERG